MMVAVIVKVDDDGDVESGNAIGDLGPKEYR